MTRTLGSGSNVLSVKRTSVAGQVASAIRAKIFSGELTPGVQLQEISMAASANVARNTMREALQILVREGLVRHNVHHGFAVTQLTDQDIDDIFRVRRLLEVSGVKAAAKAKVEHVATLDAIVEEIQRAVDASDWPRSVESDLLFHRQLVSFLGSDRLNSFFGTTLSELRLALVLVDRTSFDSTHLPVQHRELAKLLRDGQISECVAQLNQHLNESEHNIRDIISMHGANIQETTTIDGRG